MPEASSLDMLPIWRLLPEIAPGEGATLVLRDGTFRMLIRAGAVNFDMKSPAEQQGITHAFGEMLNALDPDFPIQILCHTKNLDADSYMRQFDARRRQPGLNPRIRALLEDHCEYFENQVRSRNLLQREFYVVVPAGSVAEPVSKGQEGIPGWSILKALIAPSEDGGEPKLSSHDIDGARQQLDLRAHLVEGYLGRIDIPTRRLGEVEVRELIHEMCNPDLARRQRLRAAPRGEGLFPGLRVDDVPTRTQRELEPKSARPVPSQRQSAPAPTARPAESAPALDPSLAGRRRTRRPGAKESQGASEGRRRSRPAEDAPERVVAEQVPPPPALD